MSVIQSKKTDYNTKINEIEKRITDHSHDKYITTLEFNKLTAENFAARLALENLVTKTDFDDKLINLNKKLTQTKQKIYQLKMNLKNYRHLIQSIFVIKVILKMMVLKIVQSFKQHKDVLKRLVIIMTIFYHGNLKDYLMKVLSVLLHLTIFLIFY